MLGVIVDSITTEDTQETIRALITQTLRPFSAFSKPEQPLS